MSVVIETTLGDVTVDLFIKERPQTCLNFLKLCKIKYYNLCLFHSVNSNFLAQTGDPTGKGDGGESIFGILKGNNHRLFQAEKLPRMKHDQAGLLSMVSHGESMCGSQFIITLSNDLGSLDQEHCVFGHVVEGTETLLKLNDAITDDQHRPYQDIRITHTVILEDPYPDPDGLVVPPLSPMGPSLRDAAYSRIPADEILTENCSQEELDEMVQQREAAARAAILEMVGDLPDAEAAPPENVLFVCKLNPVTSDHDLAIIFSRFGTVKSCEVIRDQVTGDSLQYAFVEFEERKACEDAYFKMDNVLIDDRRIHVDFSQSVAKLRWKGKGRGVDILGPPPPGGWGNNQRDREPKRKYDSNRKMDRSGNNYRGIRNQPERIRNGKRKDDVSSRVRRVIHDTKRLVKKEKDKEKLKRRKSTSSSSSTETSSETSSTSESSDSSRKRKKSRSRKVLVVVKTPRRSKTHKKPRKVRRNKKYESDSSESEDDKKKKKKLKRKYTTEDSSSEEIERRKRKKQQDDSKKRRKKRRKSVSSECSSEEETKKLKAKKRKQHSQSTSDSEPARKRRKDKIKSSRRRVSKAKKRRRSETASSTSSDSS